MGLNLRYSPLEYNSPAEEMLYNEHSLNIDEFLLNVKMTTVSTSGSTWVVCPYAAKIKTIYSVLRGTIGTANAGITVEIANTAVTGGAITIAYSGSAAGDVDSAVPTALNTVAAGQAIEIITNGASANAVEVEFTLVMQRT